MKRFSQVLLLTLVAVTISLLSGCSRHDNNERYILVTVNSKLAYWQTESLLIGFAGADGGG